MKFKFYVTLNRMIAGELHMFPVLIKETNLPLEFADYIDAEGWIKEQRANDSKEMYQLQKFYTA